MCDDSDALLLQKLLDSEDVVIENFKLLGDILQRSRESMNMCLILRDPELQFSIQSANRSANLTR